MSRVTWLHLSDLHRAQRGDGGRWPNFRDPFLADLRVEKARIGTPDMVFFTGDLAYSGERDQYDRVDETLDDIRNALDADPWFVCVPGNHDLTRPKNAPHRVVLQSYRQRDDDALARTIAEGCPVMRSILDEMFSGYMHWWHERVSPAWQSRGVMYELGPVPGDFRASLLVNGLKIGLVGLNTGFLHMDDVPSENLRTLRIEQEQAGNDLPRWASRHDACFLLLHHPKNWLAIDAERTLLNGIYQPDRFVACLFGHMHEPGYGEEASVPGKPRRFVQSPSLFGLEEYGTSHEKRTCGYAWGRLTKATSDGGGRLRRWVKRCMEGDNRFERDPTATDKKDIRVRLGAPSARGTVGVVADGINLGDACATMSAAIYALPEAGWVTREQHPSGPHPDITVVITSPDSSTRPTTPPAQTVVVKIGTTGESAASIQTDELEGAVRATRALLARLAARERERPTELALAQSTEQPPLDVPADVTAINESAKRLYQDEDFAEAAIQFTTVLAALEALQSATADNSKFTVERAKARMNVAACMLSLNRVDEARAQLEALAEWRNFDSRLRLTLARLWTYAGELELAAEVLPPEATDDELLAARQLIEIRSGRLPKELHPDVKLDALELMLDQGRLAEAAELAREVIRGHLG